jgi:hypothetical protein
LFYFCQSSINYSHEKSSAIDLTYQGKEYPGMKAFCTKAGEERMFRVDRILKVETI